MKTRSYLTPSILLLLLLLATAWGIPPKTAPNWKTDPLLRSINISAQQIMGEYEAWSEDWTKSDKKPTEKDKAINRLTETFFITLINALAVAPNPELATQSARFLDTKVPAEFNDMWKFVFIEITNVTRDAEGRLVQSEHRENLKQKAMRPR